MVMGKCLKWGMVMARPRKPRCIQFTPTTTYFKPAGVPLRTLEEVGLSMDELEALRLKDVEGLVQEECARQMQLSQSTFQRILAGARGKVATALVSGSAIRIEGEAEPGSACHKHDDSQRNGQRRARRGAGHGSCRSVSGPDR